jgi:hypothetical protein
MKPNTRAEKQTCGRSPRWQQRGVKMRPPAKEKVMAKLPTAYCQRIMDKYCVFTGTKINLCLAEAATRKEAWELAAAS